MAKHCYVPDDFGGGTVIPLIKDKLGNANDLNNYRGITLIPVISKLFELVLAEICKPYLRTDDLQFGFRRVWDVQAQYFCYKILLIIS